MLYILGKFARLTALISDLSNTSDNDEVHSSLAKHWPLFLSSHINPSHFNSSLKSYTKFSGPWQTFSIRKMTFITTQDGKVNAIEDDVDYELCVAENWCASLEACCNGDDFYVSGWIGDSYTKHVIFVSFTVLWIMNNSQAVLTHMLIG